MSYTPGPSPYRPSGPHLGSPEPRRNLPLIGGAVVVCTAMVLGAVLLVVFMSNRGAGTERAADDTEETTASPASESAEPPPLEGDGDMEAIAVAVVEILYGQSDESAEGYLCDSPGYNLANVEVTGAAVADAIGDLSDLIDEFVVVDTSAGAESVDVTVAMVIYGDETEMGVVKMVVEDGRWLACDFTY